MFFSEDIPVKIQPDLRDGRIRLRTFLKSEMCHSKDIIDFAEAGFIAVACESEKKDLVQCVWCAIVLGDWTNENPLKEHEQKSSRCPFMQGYDVGNIPIIVDPIRDVRSPVLGNYDVTDIAHVKKVRTDLIL